MRSFFDSLSQWFKPLMGYKTHLLVVAYILVNGLNDWMSGALDAATATETLKALLVSTLKSAWDRFVAIQYVAASTSSVSASEAKTALATLKKD